MDSYPKTREEIAEETADLICEAIVFWVKRRLDELGEPSPIEILNRELLDRLRDEISFELGQSIEQKFHNEDFIELDRLIRHIEAWQPPCASRHPGSHSTGHTHH